MLLDPKIPGVPTKTHLESRIKTFNPPLVCIVLVRVGHWGKEGGGAANSRASVCCRPSGVNELLVAPGFRVDMPDPGKAGLRAINQRSCARVCIAKLARPPLRMFVWQGEGEGEGARARERSTRAQMERERKRKRGGGRENRDLLVV